MSYWGKINAKFIFIEGLSKDSSWDSVLVKAGALRDKVFEAATATEDSEEGEVIDCDYRLDDGQLTLDDGTPLKCCVFTMGERNENFEKGYILNALQRLAVPDFNNGESINGDDPTAVFKEICRCWHCCCEVNWKSERLEEKCRAVIGPFENELWMGCVVAYAIDLFARYPWENIVGRNYAWMKRRVDDEEKTA